MNEAIQTILVIIFSAAVALPVTILLNKKFIRWAQKRIDKAIEEEVKKNGVTVKKKGIRCLDNQSRLIYSEPRRNEHERVS